ncbi:PDZ domain-containing protein [Bacillus pakistanensis]|uniref:endopeptidase La n=1 Tax=Rossellomorea pakistanensis TaxID=992288 RepID=A0ABS2NFW6_9BACI|nr:SepM family pheromone-processing serine protease [Bacillus pakistanensis]MBM7586718.1 PDZ domain-containing protein [Bacillus pakistanensis]
MSQRNWIRTIVVFTIIIVAASFYYLPYYVTKPGSAHVLDPIVEVEGGFEDEGELMLTTVRMGRANIFTYAIAALREYEYIYPVEEIRSPHESDEEYNVRQLYLMKNSKHNAIQVAFEKANKPVSFDYKGVYVLNVYKEMPASKVLKAGDRITAIDENQFQSSEEFIKYVSEKKEGEEVNITYKRDQKEHTAKIALAKYPKLDKIGLGIGLVDDREIETTPSVELKTDEIGGPSAGFMFSLEIYNQLVKEDITNGKEIAGTGTISEAGEVGRIGGIEQKVIAADDAGAEIFFAPDDKIKADMRKADPTILSNYEAAKKAAEDINTDMKIVPVQTFDDALKYLSGL